jgi:group II intron reverse transcriptase/maturase
MRTKLARISKLSADYPEMVFEQLMHHFNMGNLESWYQLLNRKAAVGIDGITKENYGENLQENLENLHHRMKTMSYVPGPARQTLIPKEGKSGVSRPLGIGNFEDKIVQKGVQKVLESIYEPLFLKSSFGFRPNRSCHDAIKALRSYLYSNPVRVVIDLDISNYFGTIDHGYLMEILSGKIRDKRFLRYIRRMFKAGILSEGELIVSDEGVPQGSVCSPVLANIYAHYVLDEWFDGTVKRYCGGKVEIFRYADDAVICCEKLKDAERIKAALIKRFAKYNLKLNSEKTKLVKYNVFERENRTSFDFLGFTFYLGSSRSGATVPKLKSSGKKLRVKLTRVNLWCKLNRSKIPLRELWKKFCSKLRGHIQYYSVSFNYRAVHKFVRRSQRIFFKWLNRRSQKKSMTINQFEMFKQRFPPPAIKICHELF